MRAICLGLVLIFVPAFAVTVPSVEEECCELNLWTGEGVSIGNWLLPELNYQMAAGSSTIDPARLAAGHHDPDRHGITHQNLELSLTARLNSYISIFGTYATKVDHDDRWISEYEEYYISLQNLPGGLRARGGRFQARVGYQNELHVHNFEFVDQYLVNARMFGEDPLVIYGAEASVPVLRTLPKGWDDRLTVSFGAIPEPDEEEHVSFGPEPEFEAEGNLFAEWAAIMNYRLGYAASESTRYEFGISGVWGENDFGRHSQVYGLHFEYLWKAAGVGDHGHGHGHAHHHHSESAEFFRWRSEVFTRHFGAVSGHEEEEEGHAAESAEIIIPAQPEVRRTERQLIGRRLTPPGSFVPVYRTREVVVREAQPARVIEAEEPAEEEKPRRDEFMDMGFYTALTYGFPSGSLQAHLRAEYTTGVSEAGLPERWRISPALAWRPTDRLPVYLKLQYNYDHSPTFGSEHSIWAQFNVTWGDCCAH
jgi:hypothetical protein